MDNPKKQQMKGNWKQFKGRLQELWGELTDDELDTYRGRREQLEGYLVEKTGKSRERIREQIDRVAKELEYSI